MILVEKDDDIKWFNMSLLAKMKEYNIVLPHLNDLKMLDFNNLQKVEDGIANSLKHKEWFDSTIACWDISQGCQGCNNKQFDYTLCNAGCFGANTGCASCVHGQEDKSCQGCNSTNEACNTCNTGCEGCDDGCFGTCNGCDICNSDCYGCNEGCQGAQTCQTCNAGEGCVSGCQGDYTAGCEQCNDDYNYCSSGYSPACNRSQAKYGCASCNTSCQSADICESDYSLCSTCVSCVRGNTCTTGNQYIESAGCTSKNVNGCMFFFSGCTGKYTVNKDDGSMTCEKEYNTNDILCTGGYKVGGGVSSCPSLYAEYIGLRCDFEYSSDGHCSSNFVQDFTTCKSNYDSAINTPDGKGLTCASDFKSDTGISCASKYTGTEHSTECASDYKGVNAGCSSGFSSANGSTSCKSGYTGYGLKCEEAYSNIPGSAPVCIRGYSDLSVDCPSNYNNTCSACNVSSDNVCIDCVGGEAAKCKTCVGNGNDANCSSCVAGVESGCTECVDGNGGCTDCQGCDSGCNAGVSCSGYSVSEDGNDVCVGQFTDTSCNQTCIGGYDSAISCLSGQGCTSCDSGCDGCDSCQGCVSCQGCDTEQSGCGPCDSCNTCQSCHGCDGCDGCVSCQSSCNTCQGCYSGTYLHECPGEYGSCGQTTCSGGCYGAQ